MLDGLLEFKLYIAFNPYDVELGFGGLTEAPIFWPPSENPDYWTDCSDYLRSFETEFGKQHQLETMEPATCKMQLNGRDGFFYNGAKNGTGFVLQPMNPICIVANYYGDDPVTNEPIFFGRVDAVPEANTDIVNLDLNLSATDQTKSFTQDFLNCPDFWQTYSGGLSTTEHWYRLGEPNNAVVTYAEGNGTTVTYWANNTFEPGMTVTITGLVTKTGASLNLDDQVVVTANPKTFTVTNSTVGTTNAGQNGLAYSATIGDATIYGTPVNALYGGAVSFPANGAVIYDTNQCVDLANGTGKGTGYIKFPDSFSPTIGTIGAFDFWVLGDTIAGSTVVTLDTYDESEDVVTLQMGFDSTGLFYVNDSEEGITTDSGSVRVNDGFWHHVGIAPDEDGYLCAYVDGSLTRLSGSRTAGLGWTGPLYMGANGDAKPQFVGYLDELVISNDSVVPETIINRFVAGHLLQGSNVLSGDRIAELLCLAGYGTISGGVVVIQTNTYYIHNAYETAPGSYEWGLSGNGYLELEPYYWDEPVYDSTVQDLINQIQDTDIGLFFQAPNGTFHFFTQNYYGIWAPPNGPIDYHYTTPSGFRVWADDVSISPYNYDGTKCTVTRDAADLWTKVKVTPQAGVDQIAQSTVAVPRWGKSTLEKADTVHPTLAAALSTAQYLLFLYCNYNGYVDDLLVPNGPLPRVSSVELAAETVVDGMVGGMVPAMIETSMGDVVQFARNAPNASTSGSYPSVMGVINQPMVIESISHSYQAEPGMFHSTFVLDPYPVRANP